MLDGRCNNCSEPGRAVSPFDDRPRPSALTPRRSSLSILGLAFALSPADDVLLCAQNLGAPQLIGSDDSNGRYRRGARGWPNSRASGFGIIRIGRSALSENLIIAIFLQAWLQSSAWPRRLDIRHRILAQFEAINQVADALRRVA